MGETTEQNGPIGTPPHVPAQTNKTRQLGGTTTAKKPSTHVSLFDKNVVKRLVSESRREQGLPETVSDSSVIARLAILVGGGRK